MDVTPLWDENAHPEHLRLEALLVVTQSTSEEKEAGAVGLMLAETFITEIYPHDKSKNTFKGKNHLNSKALRGKTKIRWKENVIPDLGDLNHLNMRLVMKSQKL